MRHGWTRAAYFVVGAALMACLQPTLAAQRYRAINLGVLGVDSSGYGYTFPVAINNAGQIAGYAYLYDGSGQYSQASFLYSGGSLVNLGNFGTDAAGRFYSQLQR